MSSTLEATVCPWCNRTISSHAGNPFLWPIALPVGGGKIQYYCTGCVAAKVKRVEELEIENADLRRTCKE